MRYATPVEAKTESLPARGAWIEMIMSEVTGEQATSLPARGAWIEMAPVSYTHPSVYVAPREGSVD